jgi:hypothetical protein
MKKKIILILLVFITLSSILFVNLENKSTAQECNDCATPIPTPPGDSNYSKINCNCTGAIPTIKASASTIASGGSITLWVDSGGKACPDFNWSISSAKYTLNKNKTTNDLETVTMTAASGTCSTTGYNNSNIYVTVTVTDRCGITSQAIIRNTSGQWGSITYKCNNGNSCTSYYLILGSRRYFLCGGLLGLNTNFIYQGTTCSGCSASCSSYALTVSPYTDIFPSDGCYKFKLFDADYCFYSRRVPINNTDAYGVDSAGYQNWVCP